MIRQAVRADIPALVDLSIEALLIDPYEELVIDRNRVYECVAECVLGINNFAWVSENEHGIQGGLGALTMPLMMYQRCQSQIAMWYCKLVGDGIKLMKQFLAWVKTRIMIRQVLFSPERGADTRITKIALRLGFKEVLPTYVWMR